MSLRESPDLTTLEIAQQFNPLMKSVNALNSMFVTPQMFGAVGDGVTDDTAAFNAAINYRPVDPQYNVIGDNAVYVPTGRYLITSLNPILGSLNLVGDGNGSVLIVDTTGDAIYYNPSVGSQYFLFHMNGFRIETPNHTPSSIIRLGANAVNPLIENINMNSNTATYGILSNANYGMRLRNVIISEATMTAGIRIVGLNMARIDGCDITNTAGDGIQVTNGDNLTILDTVIESNSGTGLHLNSDGSNFTWNVKCQNCYFEANGKHIDANGNGNVVPTTLTIESTVFHGTNSIDLGGNTRLVVINTSVSGGSPTTITGSASAKAMFINSFGFTNSGVPSWWGIGGSGVGADNDTAYPVAFTPEWTCTSGTQPSLGNGTLVGYYSQIGHEVHATIVLTAGSTTTFGTGAWAFSLPFPTADIVTQWGKVFMEPHDGASLWTGFVYAQKNASIVNVTTTSGGTVNTADIISAGIPFTWASGDKMTIDFRYWTAY